MKDDSTPATKADIQSLLKQELKPINDRLDGLDERMNGLDERMDGLDRKLDGFRKETAVKLDEIHRECGILIENTHRDVAGASADVDQILREKNEALEVRVARLEEAVGLTAA